MRLFTVLLAAAVLAGCGSAGSEPGPARRTSTTPAATQTPAAERAALVVPASGTPTRVVAKVRTGGSPCGVVGALGSVWVTDAENGRLLRIDPRRHRVVQRIEVDARPCELAFAAGHLWVVTQVGLLDRVDPRTGRVTPIPVGATSYEPLFAFGAIWVSNRGDGTVSKVDPGTAQVVETARLTGRQPGGIAATPDALWVGDDTSGAHEVLRVDPTTLSVTPVRAGGRPAFVAATGDSVWVANEDDGTVTRLDARTGRTLGTVSAGVRPVNLTPLPGAVAEVWVPDDRGSTVTRIDAASGTVLERLAVGDGPAVVSAVGSDVWVSSFEDGTVWQLRPGAR